jgi:hypothetical protein
MIDEARVKEFVDVMNDLVDAEEHPIRSDVWAVPLLHEKRRKLWEAMPEEERQIARTMLGDRARWC